MTAARPLLLILALFVGILGALSENFSLAFLLSVGQPRFALFVPIVAGFLTARLMNRPGQRRRPVGYTGATIFAALALAHLAAASVFAENVPFAIAWYLAISLGVQLTFWVLTELSSHYLPAADLPAFLPRLFTTAELGAIGVLLLSRLTPDSLPSPRGGAVVMGLLALGLAATISYFFLGHRLRESKLSRVPHPTVTVTQQPFRDIAVLVGVLGLATGLLARIIGYLSTTVIHAEATDFASVRERVADLLLLGSVGVVVVNQLVTRLVPSRRVSPFTLLWIYFGSTAALAVSCLIIPSLRVPVLLGGVTRATGRSLYSYGMTQVFSGYPRYSRGVLRSYHLRSMLSISGLPILLLPVLVDRLELATRIDWMIAVTLALIALACVLVALLRQRVTKSLWTTVELGDKESAIVAFQSLSYVKPGDFRTRAIRMLERSPKTLLRKHVIQSLALHPGPETRAALIAQLGAEQEEIRIESVRALARQGLDSEVINFAISGDRGPRVRDDIVASLSVVGQSRLRTRILRECSVAAPTPNLLALLGRFDDPELASRFREWARHSSSPAVRATAYAAIARLPGNVGEALDRLRAMTLNADPSEAHAAHLAIAEMGSRLIPELRDGLRGAAVNGLRAGLAGTISPEIAVELFCLLTPSERSEALKVLASEHRDDPLFKPALVRILKQSHREVHEDLDHLETLAA